VLAILILSIGRSHALAKLILRIGMLHVPMRRAEPES